MKTKLFCTGAFALGTRVQPEPLPNKPGLEFMDAFWSAQLSPSP